MSVDKIKKFRYSSGGGELSWPNIRRVDVSSFRVEEPDLRFLTNLVSSLATSSFSLQSVREGTDTDLVQLFQLLQLCLQFTLWSQNVLKEELVETQNGRAVQTVTARYVAELELKNKHLKKKLEEVTKDRDTLHISSTGLTQSLSQMETAVDILKRQLKAERERSAELVDRLEKQGDRFHAKALSARVTQSMPPPENPYVDSTGIRWEADHAGRPCCPLCHAKRHKSKHVERESDTSFSEDGTVDTASSSRRRRPKSRWFARSRLDEEYLLQQLLDLQVQQRNTPAAAPATPPPADDTNHIIVQKQLDWVSDTMKQLSESVGRQIEQLGEKMQNDSVSRGRQMEDILNTFEHSQAQLKEECLGAIQVLKQDLEKEVGEQKRWMEDQLKGSPTRNPPLSARSDRPVGGPKTVPRPTSSKGLHKFTPRDTPINPQLRSAPSVPMSSSYISLDREASLDDAVAMARPPAAPLVSSGYSPYNEDQPIGVFGKTSPHSSLDTSQNVSPQGEKQFPSGADDPATPDRPVDTDTALCVYCHQRLPRSELTAHENSCEFRVVTCDKCGAGVVARMLRKHQCSAKCKSSRPDSPSTSMLQDAQRELKALMDEEEAENKQKGYRE